MEPERIGRYRILRLLGQGGMGAVYEALQEPIQRRVALKLLLPQFGQNQDMLQRFFNEAHAVNLIEHPSLVQIADYGQTPDGTAYLVMEYLRGETLGARLSRHQHSGTRLPMAQLLQIAAQISDALAAAHDKSVIHRDLKPANVMMVPDPAVPWGERAKILDFGIAKFAQGMGQATATAAIMGTPQYMSPEQCKGTGNVDGKTDVYALGIMLFEMIAGRPPFQAEGAFDFMGQHVFQPPPPLRTFAPDTSIQIVNLVHRLLEKDRTVRPSMRELSIEMASLMAAYPMGASAVVPIKETTPGGVHNATPTLPLSSLYSSAGESLKSRTLLGRNTKELLSIGVGTCAVLAGLFLAAPWKIRTSRRSYSAATSTPMQKEPVPLTARSQPNGVNRSTASSNEASLAPVTSSSKAPTARTNSIVTPVVKTNERTPSVNDSTPPSSSFAPSSGMSSATAVVGKEWEMSTPPNERTRKLKRRQRPQLDSQVIPTQRRSDDYEQ